jgi:hypothetical protein
MPRNWGQGIVGHSSSAAPPSFLAASLICSKQRSTVAVRAPAAAALRVEPGSVDRAPAVPAS